MDDLLLEDIACEVELSTTPPIPQILRLVTDVSLNVRGHIVSMNLDHWHANAIERDFYV